MSLRTLIRIGALALGLLLFSPLLWPLAGPWSLLAGPGLAALALAYLALGSSPRKASRWHIRYQLETPRPNERLDATLRFLSRRAGHVVLEANARGLFLEAPPAFDRYVQVQFDRALPQARVRRVESDDNGQTITEGQVYLSLDPAAGDPLRWAAGGEGRAIRLHLHRGAYTTLALRAANGAKPPGGATRLPDLQALTPRLWRRLPIWDEMSADVEVSRLLPATGDDSAYSSHPHLLRLAPPEGFEAHGDRRLGLATDGRRLSLDRDVPLFTAAAPASFLARQALDDVARGRTVVVVSPRRRVLNQIQREARAATYWLDPENARTSARLAVVSAAEWPRYDVDTIVELCQDFLAALPALHAGGRSGGLNLHLPTIRATVSHLVRILAASAKATGHDFAFTDLYAISQSPHTLKAFLADLRNLEIDLDADTRASIAHLDGQLDHDGGYLQLVTVLSTARTILSPLRSGALHVLCQPPFLDADRTLRRPGLLLAPATHADFPEYDRFLAALLDLTLDRVLTAHRREMHHRDADSAPGQPEMLQLALHFHEPQRYYPDAGRHWIETARHDPRLSLLADTRDPETYHRLSAPEEEQGELIFHAPGADARAFSADPVAALDELAEMPPGTALARLPDLPAPVTVNTDGDRGAQT